MEDKKKKKKKNEAKKGRQKTDAHHALAPSKGPQRGNRQAYHCYQRPDLAVSPREGQEHGQHNFRNNAKKFDTTSRAKTPRRRRANPQAPPSHGQRAMIPAHEPAAWRRRNGAVVFGWQLDLRNKWRGVSARFCIDYWWLLRARLWSFPTLCKARVAPHPPVTRSMTRKAAHTPGAPSGCRAGQLTHI